MNGTVDYLVTFDVTNSGMIPFPLISFTILTRLI